MHPYASVSCCPVQQSLLPVFSEQIQYRRFVIQSTSDCGVGHRFACIPLTDRLQATNDHFAPLNGCSTDPISWVASSEVGLHWFVSNGGRLVGRCLHFEWIEFTFFWLCHCVIRVSFHFSLCCCIISKINKSKKETYYYFLVLF